MNILFINSKHAKMEKTIKTVEEEGGHSVVSSNDPEIAIISTQVKKFNIIILDIANLKKTELEEIRKTIPPERMEKYKTEPGELIDGKLENLPENLKGEEYKIGLQTLQKIKEIDPKQVVIITHSCPCINDVKTYCEKLGANAVLAKPYLADDLLKIINEIQ